MALTKETVLGYKGFKKTEDGKLKCLDQVFEAGKTYVYGGEPKVCSRGFHMCEKLIDVFTYYEYKDINAFYFVKGSGLVDRDLKEKNKIAVQELEIIKEVSINDLKEAFTSKYLAKIDILMESDPDIVIGGSLALILQDVIPPRHINDIDVALPYFTNFDGKGTPTRQVDPSGQDAIPMVVKFNDPETNKPQSMSLDLFVDQKTIYTTIEFLGKKYKVQNAHNILMAKAKYMFYSNRGKHANDLLYVLQTIIENNNFGSTNTNVVRRIKTKSANSSTKETKASNTGNLSQSKFVSDDDDIDDDDDDFYIPVRKASSDLEN